MSDEQQEQPGAALTIDNYNQSREDLRCVFDGCRHLAHTSDSLVLHISTHCPFEVPAADEERSGSTRSSLTLSYDKSGYQCGSCSFLTSYRLVFREHIRHHLLGSPYSCGHCGLGFDSIALLRQHNKLLHRLFLPRLVVNETNFLHLIMIELGPQAPQTAEKKLVPVQQQLPSDKTCSVDLKDVSIVISNTIDQSHSTDLSKSESLFDGISTSLETSCLSNNPSSSAAPAPAVSDCALSQNFKYSLTNDGKFCCLKCRFLTESLTPMAEHIFNDIHHALKSACGRCKQMGKSSSCTKPCSTVEQITSALLRQKKLHASIAANSTLKKNSPVELTRSNVSLHHVHHKFGESEVVDLCEGASETTKNVAESNSSVATKSEQYSSIGRRISDSVVDDDGPSIRSQPEKQGSENSNQDEEKNLSNRKACDITSFQFSISHKTKIKSAKRSTHLNMFDGNKEERSYDSKALKGSVPSSDLAADVFMLSHQSSSLTHLHEGHHSATTTIITEELTSTKDSKHEDRNQLALPLPDASVLPDNGSKG